MEGKFELLYHVGKDNYDTLQGLFPNGDPAVLLKMIKKEGLEKVLSRFRGMLA